MVKFLYLVISCMAVAYLQRGDSKFVLLRPGGYSAMVELTVVFFCVEKEGCGRIKRRGKWQYSIEESYVPHIFPSENGADSRIKRLIVHLPAYSCKKKEREVSIL